jgi:hypothetical protein
MIGDRNPFDRHGCGCWLAAVVVAIPLTVAAVVVLAGWVVSR